MDTKSLSHSYQVAAEIIRVVNDAGHASVSYHRIDDEPELNSPEVIPYLEPYDTNDHQASTRETLREEPFNIHSTLGVKRTPIEWEEIHRIKILDPDGWRLDDKSFTEPITEAEFYDRAAISTICKT